MKFIFALFCLFPVLAFSQGSFVYPNTQALPLWENWQKSVANELNIYEKCETEISDCDTPLIFSWRNKIQAEKGNISLSGLQKINQYMNEQFTITERTGAWATPIQMAQGQASDVGLTLMKWQTLKDIGHEPENLTIYFVKDTFLGKIKPVLGVKLDKTYILDNVYNHVTTFKNHRHYIPVYGFNEQHTWIYSYGE